MHRLVHIVLVLAILVAPSAAQTPALKPAALVSGSAVLLGDLVENAGKAAAMPLFRAPELGRSGIISASRIIEAAAEAGLSDIDLRGIVRVEVRRPARAVTADEITASISDALKRSDRTLADVTLKLDAAAPPLSRDALDQAALVTELLSLDRKLERFEARLLLPDTPGDGLKVTGSYDTRLSVPVPIRDIPRGETIQASDLKSDMRPRKDVVPGLLTDAAQISGLVARKALRVGQPIREGDVVRPNLVERNQLVTVLYESAGMALSLRGKALAPGAEGAIVPVQNLQSKRTIETIVIGPGRVSARHPASE